MMIKNHRLLVAAAVVSLLAACTAGGGGATTTEGADTTHATQATTATTTPPATTTSEAATTTTTAAEHEMGGEATSADVVVATLANVAFQDVAAAEAAGYGSTIDALGCFESAEKGGMGLHYLNESLMDGVVDIATPEALVYELGTDGEITGLVAHEYIIPVDAWTDAEPPSLFGVAMHQHSVLPLWVLHAWVWEDNPAGMFEDYNPKVRLCPEGVPVFGVDLP